MDKVKILFCAGQKLSDYYITTSHLVIVEHGAHPAEESGVDEFPGALPLGVKESMLADFAKSI